MSWHTAVYKRRGKIVKFMKADNYPSAVSPAAYSVILAFKTMCLLHVCTTSTLLCASPQQGSFPHNWTIVCTYHTRSTRQHSTNKTPPLLSPKNEFSMTAMGFNYIYFVRAPIVSIASLCVFLSAASTNAINRCCFPQLSSAPSQRTLALRSAGLCASVHH